MTTLGINGLAPGFKYDVRVRGIFDGQAGQWSPTYEIDVFSDTSSGTGDKAPAAVTDLAVTPTIDSFIITWTAPTRNADGTVLDDMKDYVLEVSDVAFGTADATYLIPEHNKPSDLSTVDRQHQFEFTYKMNKELYGTATPTLYVRIYARDTTNNRSAPDTANATNTEPSAPGTPSLTPFGGGIAVSWTAGGADTVEYVLRAHTASMADPPVTGTEIYRGTVLNFSHITTGTKYYRVGAVDIFGQTNWSAEAFATALSAGADTTPPAVPTSLADAWQSTSYVLTWTPPADVDVVRYQIDIRNNGNTVTKTFYSEGPRFELSIEDNISAFGTVELDPYYVRVWAIDAAGNISATYAELNAAATDAAPSVLAAPTLATPVIDAGGIYVSWPKVTDSSNIFDYYELYGTGTGSTTIIYTGDASFFRYALPSAYSGTYYFRARAKDKFGRYSTYSSEVSVTATSTLTAPTSSVAGSLDPADPSNRTGIITVSSISGPSSPILAGFKLRYKKAADSNWTELDVNKTATTYVIKNIPPGVSHNVEMASYDVMGRVSGTWTASTGSPVTVTADTSAGSAPTSVALNSGATSLNVTFTGVTATDIINQLGRYEIEIAKDSGFTTGNLKQTQPGGTASQNHIASFTGLTPADTYWARVRAIDAVGNVTSWAASTPTSLAVGSSGNPSDGNVPTGTIPTPTAINGIGGIHVRWTAMTNADVLSYEVHVGVTSGFSPSGSTLIGTVTGTYFFAKVDGTGTALSYGQNYYFKLRPFDIDGPHASYGSASNAAQVVTVATVDITDGNVTENKIAGGAVTANKLAVIVGGGNILANAGFESWATGLPTSWSKGASTTITQVTGRLGTGSAVRHTATTAGNVGTNRLSQILAGNQVLAADTKYTISAYVKRNSGTGGLDVAFDGLGTYNLAPAGSVTTSWVRYSVTITTGGTAPSPFSFYNTVANDVFEIDDVQLEVGDVMTAWAPRTDEILPGTIIASQIAADTITANEIASNAITVNELAANAVTAAKIATGEITSDKINTSGINADRINIGGNASNMVPQEWADFEFTSTMYDSGGALRPAFVGTPTLVQTSATQFKFGSRAMAVTVDAASEGIYFNTSATTYNIPVLSGKTYIVSAYVRTTNSGTATLRYKPSGGSDTNLSNSVTATTANTWVRVYGTFTAGSDTTVNLSILFSATSGIQYIDGVMMEERVGTQNTPSGFVKPGTVIDGAQIVTGTLVADKITSGTLDASQVSVTNLDATDITTGTLNAARIGIGGSGNNLVPLQYADFENLATSGMFWSDKFTTTNVTATITSGAGNFNTGSQALSANVTSTTTPSIYLAGSSTEYNINVSGSKKYIVSAWIKAPAGGTSVTFKLTGNSTSPSGVPVSLTGGTAWTRYSALITMGANDTIANLSFTTFTATGVYLIDSVMVEEQIGNATTPSTFSSLEGTIIDGSRITTGSILADQLATGSIVADKIDAGAISADKLESVLVMSSVIKTASSGQRVEISESGVALYNDSGDIMVNLPTSGDASFMGTLTATDADMVGDVIFRDSATYASGSLMTFASGVSDPVAKPAVTYSVPTLKLGNLSSSYSVKGIFYDPNGDVGGSTPTYLVALSSSSTNNYIAEYSASDGAFIRSSYIDDYVPYGITRVGSYIFLVTVGSAGKWRIRRYNQSNLASNDAVSGGLDVSDVVPEYEKPSITTDGTYPILITRTNVNDLGGGTLRFKRYTTAQVFNSNSDFTGVEVGGQLYIAISKGAVYVDDAGYGACWWVALNNTDWAKIVPLTEGSSSAPVGTAPAFSVNNGCGNGITHNGTNFVGAAATSAYIFTNDRSSAARSASFVYSWVDSVNGKESDTSPSSRLTLSSATAGQRGMWKVSVPSPPVGVDQVKIYALSDDGASFTGGQSPHYLQATINAPASTVSLSSLTTNLLTTNQATAVTNTTGVSGVSATVTRTTTSGEYLRGGSGWKIVTTTSGNGWTTSAANGERIPVREGGEYYAHAFAKQTGTKAYYWKVNWYNSSDSIISPSQGSNWIPGTSAFASTGALSLGTAPAGAVTAALQCIQSTTGSNTLYLDDVMFGVMTRDQVYQDSWGGALGSSPGQTLLTSTFGESAPALMNIPASARNPNAPKAPSLAAGSAGNVNVGSHNYAVTFITGDPTAGTPNETSLADSETASITITSLAKQVNISGIPIGPNGVTARRIYRTVASGSSYLLLTTIEDNVTTTYTDNTADASLGAAAPNTDTSNIITAGMQWRNTTNRSLMQADSLGPIPGNLFGRGARGSFGIYTDFLEDSAIGAAGPYRFLAGTGQVSNLADNSHPGVWYMETLTSASSSVRLVTGDILPGIGILRFQALIRSGANNSNATNRYNYLIGFHDNLNPFTIAGSSAFFRYTDTESSGQWEVVSAKSGVSNVQASGVTVTGNGWFLLEIIINRDASRIDYYIDETLVASETNSTYIPNTTMLGRIGINKTAGNTSRGISVDHSAIFGDVDAR